jgi:molecular chaperone IbpA
MEMRTAYDFSPLYRSMIGVDHMADLIQSAMRSNGERNYPP